MKSPTRFAVLLLLVSCTFSQRCPPSQSTKFNLSIASRRNVTGHWLLSVNYWNEEGRKTRKLNHPKQITLDVGHCISPSNEGETLGIVSEVTVSPSPPADYEVVNGLGYYKLHATAKTWEDARDTCAGEGAQLIVINSDAEADVVRTYWSRKPTIPDATKDVYTHVGFHDRYVEGQYITLTGKPLDGSGYVKWDAGEPSKSTFENCGGAARNVKFHDIPCSWKLFFICEFLDL